jgi:hypothetical protein
MNPYVFINGFLLCVILLMVWRYVVLVRTVDDMETERDESQRVIAELNAHVGEQMAELSNVYEYNHALEDRLAYRDYVPSLITDEQWRRIVGESDPDDETLLGAMWAPGEPSTSIDNKGAVE